MNREFGDNPESVQQARLYGEKVSLTWVSSPQGGIFAIELKLEGDKPLTGRRNLEVIPEEVPVKLEFRCDELTEVVIQLSAKEITSENEEKLREFLGDSLYMSCLMIAAGPGQESGMQELNIDVELKTEAISPQIEKWFELRELASNKT